MTAGIIVAAGRSRRMGFDKLEAPLAGRPVLWHSLQALGRCPELSEIIVVTDEVRAARLEALVEEIRPPWAPRWRWVPGGAERYDSVAAGLDAVAANTQWVAVHDGARPLVSPDDIAHVIQRAQATGAASLAHPVVETVKRADAAGRVSAAVDREGLWAMETPQVFSLPLLREAYAHACTQGLAPTDEVSAVAALGHDVWLVESHSFNPKITHPPDLLLAERCLSSQKTLNCGS